MQRAEWALGTARRRAATWGFALLVPEGRCDRSIQTHPAEVWASDQLVREPRAAALEAAAAGAAAALVSQQQLSRLGPCSGSSTVASPTLPAITPRSGAPSAGAGDARAAGPAPLAAMSASTLREALSAVPGLGPTSPAATSVPRARPAFMDHSGGLLPPRGATDSSNAVVSDNGAGSAGSRPSDAASKRRGNKDRHLGASMYGSDSHGVLGRDVGWKAAVAKRLLAAVEQPDQRPQKPRPPSSDAAATCSTMGVTASQPSIQPALLSAPALLRVIAEILAAKAEADAVALRSGRGRLLPCQDHLAAFVMAHMATRVLGSRGSSTRSLCAATTAQAQDGRLIDALVQLVSSVRAHAGASADITRFGKSLGCMGSLEELAAGAAPCASSAALSCSDAAEAGGTDASAGGVTEAEIPRQAPAPHVRRLRFRALGNADLAPAGLPAALEQLAAAPGVGSLLAWVASGAFLGHVGEGCQLGRPLADVQVNWVVCIAFLRMFLCSCSGQELHGTHGHSWVHAYERGTIHAWWQPITCTACRMHAYSPM